MNPGFVTFRRPRGVALAGCLVVTLVASAHAETVGRLLSMESTVVVDPTTGHYLMLDGLSMTPINPALRKSRIAIVDSGIAKDHPQLADRVLQEVDFTGEGLKDEIGHGTVVALLSVVGSMSARAKVPASKWVEGILFSLKVVTRNGKIQKSAVLAALVDRI